MYIHGGGWMIGDKGGAANLFLPYTERGWNVVNVEYLAPTHATAYVFRSGPSVCRR
jgi:acetyl esterase/lipase